MNLHDVLDELSLVCANFGDGQTLRCVLEDWFLFLGGRPGEVVVVDNGSDTQTRRACLECFDDGMVDKLLLVRPCHPDTPKKRAHLAEHAAPALALKRYLLFFKFDTLPYREGHENWLVEAAECLNRGDTFAVGGSFNWMSKHHEGPCPGWYFSHKCSENFALMKRETFIRAIEEYSGQYVSSGFRSANPGDATGQGRYLIELAWERYIDKHQVYTLVRQEDSTWSVFHTNAHGEQLVKVRKNYLARKGVKNFLNAGCTGVQPPGIYYGRPPMVAWVGRFRLLFGRSAMGPYWRAFKKAFAQRMK